MSASQPERSPDTDEVFQEEVDLGKLAPIPVVVAGPVRVQALPSRIGVSRSITLTTTAETILGADPLRRSAVILAAAAIRIGSKEDVDLDSGFKLPANVPVTFTHSDTVWARADTSTAVVSIHVEEWAY
jgi:hypothetical protein